MAQDYKKEVVAKFTKLIKEYPIVGVVDMESLPAQQLQNMRSQLRGNVELVMTKKRLMKIALEQSGKEGMVDLVGHMSGMPAMLFTKDNPFTLFKTLKKNKSKAPAKEGQIAPNDIKIPAGGTPFAPGPVIGELGALGVKTKVEGGKIAVTEDTIVAKEGDEISKDLAGMLTRLNIMPMEVGLDLKAVIEEGTVYTKKVLDIDEDQFMNDLELAGSYAFNLAMEAGILNSQTVTPLVIKAFNNAKGLAMSELIMAEGIKEEVLAAANQKALALKAEVE